jgi:DNA-binding transcriptional regulator YdaS (Cro superfamily)
MHPILLRISIAVLVLAAGLAQAADRRENRPVTAFTALSLSAPIDVELLQGDREAMTIEGPEDIVAAIETRVEGGTLVIRMKPVLSFSFGRVRAQVTARAIEAIAVAGSGNVRCANLKSDALRVAITGSGDVRLGKFEGSKLEASIVGSGDIQAAGKVDRLASRIEGSGDLKAADLEAREARVSIAGSGDAAVWAREILTVSIAGSGDVRYRGDPRVEPAVAGSGSVKRLGS